MAVKLKVALLWRGIFRHVHLKRGNLYLFLGPIAMTSSLESGMNVYRILVQPPSSSGIYSSEFPLFAFRIHKLWQMDMYLFILNRIVQRQTHFYYDNWMKCTPKIASARTKLTVAPRLGWFNKCGRFGLVSWEWTRPSALQNVATKVLTSYRYWLDHTTRASGVAFH